MIKINMAKSAGFCFGVKRALDIARRAAETEVKVCMLGDIVHNAAVVNKIRAAGIEKISRLDRGEGKTLLIRAHGAAESLLREAVRKGYRIIDATCPMVKEIHNIAGRLERQGRRIIVLGDKKHDEVQGILGRLKTKAVVIDPAEHIPWSRVSKIKKAGVVVQSTQDTEKIRHIVSLLRKKIKNLVFHNTICRPTRLKQDEIRIMPRRNDLMLVIGSKTSANTRRIYEISKSLNPRSYWIASPKEIKPAWFRRVETVGITAGASTPEETMRRIIERVKNIALLRSE